MPARALATCHRVFIAWALIFMGLVPTNQLDAGLIININAGAGLASNSEALSAFQAAANEWSSRISTDIVVNIDADLVNLGNSSVIGSASSTLLETNYNSIRNAMAAHAVASPNLAILAALPTAAQFTASLPAGFSLNANMALTQANAKALGLGSLTATDATISFNSQFAFAYTSAQLNGSNVDFQTVAAHEIGHALGFVSAVDFVDTNALTSIRPLPLDLFRFSSVQLPTNVIGFTTNTRSLTPGSNDFISDTLNSFQMSTGASQGDGRQASHWKADELTLLNLGIMDPTLANGVSTLVSENDLRAMSLIGYTIVSVPEPGSIVLLVVGLSLTSCRFARRRTERKSKT